MSSSQNYLQNYTFEVPGFLLSYSLPQWPFPCFGQCKSMKLWSFPAADPCLKLPNMGGCWRWPSPARLMRFSLFSLTLSKTKFNSASLHSLCSPKGNYTQFFAFMVWISEPGAGFWGCGVRGRKGRMEWGNLGETAKRHMSYFCFCGPVGLYLGIKKRVEVFLSDW